MSKPAFKLDPNIRAEFKKRVEDFRSVVNPRNPEGVVKLGRRVMKSVLRTACSITPPAQLKAQGFKGRAVGVADRKRGEVAILADLNKIFKIVRVGGDPVDLASFHKSNRLPSNGRTRSYKQHPERKARVLKSEFNAYYQQVILKVGLLLSGWVPSALRLKVALPSWVTRHGSGSGDYVEKISASRLIIRIVNNVPYSKQITAINHIIEQALKIEAGSLVRQTKGLMERKAARNRRR